MKIEIEDISVTVIGNVELSEEELAVLRLHPKFSIRNEVTIENLDFEQELGYAKARFELQKENEEKLLDEDSFEALLPQLRLFQVLVETKIVPKRKMQAIMPPEMLQRLEKRWKRARASSMTRKRTSMIIGRKRLQTYVRMLGLHYPNQ